MLYERWRQIVRERGNELALREVASGRQWSFNELARLVENMPRCEVPVLYPQGHSAAFIFVVLLGWRDQVVLCPLEPGQEPLVAPLPPAGCCHLKRTSATTGPPRLIAFQPRQLMADGENIVSTMGLRPEWPNLGVISMAHSYGFSNLVMPLLLHGVPLILAPSPLPEAVRQAASGESALTLAAVPALWRAWHEAGAIPPQTRLALSAGAPLPVTLEQAVFEARGLKIRTFYGSSECGGIACDLDSRVREDGDCVGTPLRNVQVVLNEDGRAQVISGAVGETYWPEPDASLGAGRFQTSDLAEIKDGRVYLRGRSSDQINVAGRKVSPATIEAALGAHEAVRECLVFSVPSQDAQRIDHIVACIVARTAVPVEALRQALLSKLPAWQVPRDWWFVASLGADTRGKVSRVQWRRKYLEWRERGGAGEGGKGGKGETSNIQQPTSNIQGRVEQLLGLGWWMLDFGGFRVHGQGATQGEFQVEHLLTVHIGSRLGLHQSAQAARHARLQPQHLARPRGALYLHSAQGGEPEPRQRRNGRIALRHDASQLGRCFDQQHSGEDRFPGEMPAKSGLVAPDPVFTYSFAARHQPQQPVHETELRAVGQQFQSRWQWVGHD